MGSFFDCHQRIIAHFTEKSKAFTLSLSLFLSKTHTNPWEWKAKSFEVFNTSKNPTGSKFLKPLILCCSRSSCWCLGISGLIGTDFIFIFNFSKTQFLFFHFFEVFGSGCCLFLLKFWSLLLGLSLLCWAIGWYGSMGFFV